MVAMIVRLLACLSLVSTTLPAGARATEPASAPAAPAAAKADDADGVEVPPGSPEDVALWKRGGEVSERIYVEVKQANRVQWLARQNRYDERLDALSRKPDAPGAKKAAELLARLRPALAFNTHTYERQWPVDPTRGCRYQVLHLEGVLESAEHPRKKSQLLVVREELQDCVDKGEKALRVMADANQALRRIYAEADTILPPLPPALPPGVARPPVYVPPEPSATPAAAAPAARNE